MRQKPCSLWGRRWFRVLVHAAVLGLFVFVLSRAGLVGCASERAARPTRAAPTTLAASATVGEVSADIGSSAARIDEARLKAETRAPEVAPESAAIGEQTALLRVMQTRLDGAGADLKAQQTAIDALGKKVTGLESTIADRDKQIGEWKVKVEAERTNGLRRVLVALGSLAAVGIALSIWLVPMVWKVRAVLVCLTVLGVSIGGMWLIAWAKWIALGILVLIVGSVAYLVWRLVRTTTEAVVSAERAKTTPPDRLAEFAAWADQFQSGFTKRVVGEIRAKAKRAARGIEAFGSSPA